MSDLRNLTTTDRIHEAIVAFLKENPGVGKWQAEVDSDAKDPGYTVTVTAKAAKKAKVPRD